MKLYQSKDAGQQVVLIAPVAIHIPERSRIHIVAEFGIVANNTKYTLILQENG